VLVTLVSDKEHNPINFYPPSAASYRPNLEHLTRREKKEIMRKRCC